MTNKEAQIIIGNIPIKPEVLDDCYDITEYQAAKAMAIKALDQRWIPVSERLPEPRVNGGDKDLSEWVLVSLSTSDFDTVCGAFYCFSKKKWYRERVAFGTVTAWMPLPEPYKEDEK